MDHLKTDYQLLGDALEGSDRDAWVRLEGQYKGYIIGLIKRFGVQQDDWDDLSQEVLLVIWKRLSTYDRQRSKFRTWLQGIVRNTTMNRRRSLNARNARFVNTNFIDSVCFENMEDEDAFHQIAEEEWKKYVTDIALDNVRSVFRGVSVEIFERLLQGQEVSDIARDMDVTESTVTSSKTRVKHRLMQEIQIICESLEGYWEKER